MKISYRQLQHTFAKHSRDFGLSGNCNPANVALLEAVLQDMETDAMLRHDVGTYRGTIAVTHHWDPSTGRWMAVDIAGDFVAAFKLSTAQQAYLSKVGNVQ